MGGGSTSPPRAIGIAFSVLVARVTPLILAKSAKTRGVAIVCAFDDRFFPDVEGAKVRSLSFDGTIVK